MLQTTFGQLVVNNALPPELRDYNRVLDKKGVKQLFQQLAEQFPDQYREVSKKISDVGRDAIFTTGSQSFGLEHMRASPVAKRWKDQLKQQVQQIQSDQTMSREQKNEKIIVTLGDAREKFEKELYDDALATGNPLAKQIASGARGNPGNLRSIAGADLLYTDHRGRVLPLPVLRSYSEGLRPYEYLAGSFGARKGVLDTKFCLAEGTLVLMADYTYRQIENVKPGDVVFALNNFDELVPTVVTQVFDNGTRPCSTYYFREGRSRSMVSVTATSCHQIFSCQRDRKTKEVVRRMLPLGKMRGSRKSAIVPRGSTGGVPEPRAGLLGLLLGDGGITQSTTRFYSADPTVADNVQREALPVGLKVVHVPDVNSVAAIYSLQEIERSPTGGGIKSPFRQWLHSLRLLGKASHQKFIPPEAWTWDKASCERFAAWLLETDGCVTIARNKQGYEYGIVAFDSSSEQLAQDFRRFLREKLGVYAAPVYRQAQEGHVATFKRNGVSRQYICNHDMFGFEVSIRTDVARIAAWWKNTGVKAEYLQHLTSIYETVNAEDLPRRYVYEETAGELRTFDLEVEHETHRFVLANMLTVSNSVGDSGFLAKQLVQLNHRLVVTDDDDDEPGEEIRGYPVDTDDVDNSGTLLAQDVGDFKRNTVLTPRILKAIKASGKGRILIRSPIVGGPAGGGVFARDVGVRERGFLPQRGDFVGHAAAQSLSEGLTQGSLSSKHSGGVAGAGRPVSGFAWINQLVQSPKNFQNGATHAQFDGKITNILEAPQGGKYLFIGNEKHYVPQGLEPKVKIGDEVEAGDVMTDGIPNPSEIVHHKGIGEGRRYFVDALRDAYKNSGMSANRRNIELLSRGAINHVKVLDETDDYNPDDVVSYTDFERGWRPRADAEPVSLESARDRYLERPVLHYSVGTKLRPSVLKTMKEFGVQQVMTHREPPPFEPVMVRGMAALEQDPDWITKHLGSNLKRGFLASVHRGASADTHGTSFVPALALNPSGFGREGATTAWKPPPPALPGS